jgi:4-hydroxybenzoyl-CoA reductase subunit alpha
MTEKYSVIGRRLPRVDGILKATGSAKFGNDLSLPGMLYGKILRSTLPHAHIVHINTQKAEKLKGVRAVITGKDIPPNRYSWFPSLPHTMDDCALAIDKVRFIGDEVAAVAAIDEDIAEEALELIEVEYEELPAVFDPEEAMSPGAPRIHQGIENNILIPLLLNFGDAERGFAESDYVREDRFQTQPVQQCPLETHVTLANYDPSGKFTVWAPNQSPLFLRRDLSISLGVPENRIRIVTPFVGGGFGVKHETLSLTFCSAFLARKTGRPVKIKYTREEQFIATRHRHPLTIMLKTGVKKDGTLVAKKCKAIIDAGAYAGISPIIPSVVCAFLTVLYRLKNVQFEGYVVYTNNTPAGAHRGFGNPQIRFAAESQLDMIAEDLGMDPAELRLKNAVQSGDITPNKFRITSCGLSDCIKEATTRSRWKEKQGKLPPYRGIGMACGNHTSGARLVVYDSSSCLIRLEEDGTVSLLSGAPDCGQGSDTTISQIVAEELGVTLEDIKITSADSEITPVDLGTGGSRVTFIAGNAAKAAAKDAKEQLLKVAAKILDVGVEHLEIKNRRIYAKNKTKIGISVAEAVQASLSSEEGRHILGRGFYNPNTESPNPYTGEGNISPAYSFGAQVAEVEIDPETGQVKVLKMTCAHDVGFAINPMALEGQIEGSILTGMGQALFEEIAKERGQILDPSFLMYKMPTSMQMPEIESILIETIDPEGPFGAKGVGESTQIPTVPSIVNAIYDAIGVRFKNLPITPDKILQALEGKKCGKNMKGP